MISFKLIGNRAPLGLWAAIALGTLPTLAAADAPAAGSVTMLTGRGTLSSPDGTVRPLLKGDTVHAGDVLSSGANSYINIRFTDGAFVLLRPRSRFQINDYRVETTATKAGAAPAAAAPATTPAAAPNSVTAAPAPLPLITEPPAPGSHMLLSLLKGGFRAVTGLIGKANHDDYSLATPIATIGIRGTDYLGVICDTVCARDPVIVHALPPGVSAQGGLVTGVFKGRISVGTKGLCTEAQPQDAASNSCIDVDQGHYHLTTADGQQIDLPGEPHFLSTDPIPDPQQCPI
jgi:hypothetical protein